MLPFTQSEFRRGVMGLAGCNGTRASCRKKHEKKMYRVSQKNVLLSHKNVTLLKKKTPYLDTTQLDKQSFGTFLWDRCMFFFSGHPISSDRGPPFLFAHQVPIRPSARPPVRPPDAAALVLFDSINVPLPDHHRVVKRVFQ